MIKPSLLVWVLLLFGITCLPTRVHAQQQGVHENRWLEKRSAADRPKEGLLSGLMTRRQAVREARRSAVKPSAPPASAHTPASTAKKAPSPTPGKVSSKRSKAEPTAPVHAEQQESTSHGGKEVKRNPGRPGKGTGMAKQRRRFLKPLFGR